MAFGTNSKKIEKNAINKIENWISELEFVDSDLKVDDTGISWDGEIILYSGKIGIKENYQCSIKTQVKGRTTNIKKLQDKRKFDIDKRDLENYLKEDGTIFLVVYFRSIDDFKIYYADLLPYNLRKYLNEKPNNKNEVKVRIKEVKNSKEFETILRNFAINRKEQKRISENVFKQEGLIVNNDLKIKFYDWHQNDSNILDLIGKEKYLYGYDSNDNITSINYVTLINLSQVVEVEIKNKSGELYYNSLNYKMDSTKNRVYFGKGFYFNQSNKTFNIKIKGTLKERIKQIKFIEDFYKDKGFYINDFFFEFDVTFDDIKQCIREKDNYLKIEKFLYDHHIEKDINFDDWNYGEFTNLLTWIDGIENKTPLIINNWDMSRIGSIKMHDLIFSIFAEKQKNDKYIVYSLWNDKKLGKYYFKYDTGIEKIETQNFYSILNAQAYCSDDIDINLMKNIIKDYKLEPNEELLINLQALEVIKAYDINKNNNLLDYALFLLEKIKNYEKMKDIVLINKFQIKKRKNKLSEEEKAILLKIKDNHDDLFYKISINLLIDEKDEAKRLFNELEKYQQDAYKDYPIAIYL